MLRSVRTPPGKSLRSFCKAHPWLCAVIAAVILSLPFSFGRLWILGWCGFVPLFCALEQKTKIKAFLVSYVCGFVFWCATIYWLVHVTLIGLLILVSYLALYFGLFGLMISFLVKRFSFFGCLVAAGIWTLLEYARAHCLTGFGWALLGYSQALNLPVIQIADVTGAWGVSFIMVMVNAAVYSLCDGRSSPTAALRGLGAVMICLAAVAGYGYYRLTGVSAPPHTALPALSVVQGNIPQNLKWDTQARNFIMGRYGELTEEAAREKPALIIWPEASLPVVAEEEPQYLERVCALAKKTRIPLLLGAVTATATDYFNSALFISAEGRVVTKYHKLHLVPFGEYIPLRRVIPFLETIAPIGDITPGRDYTVFTLHDPAAIPSAKGGALFSVLICFEDVFPELSRAFVRGGAEFLVNITNDGWYGPTSAAYQHMVASLFRAVENRVPVVRSANTGLSVFIDPGGRIVSSVHDARGRMIFVPGYRTHTLDRSAMKGTLYSRFGDSVVLFCLVVVVFCGIIRTRKNNTATL